MPVNARDAESGSWLVLCGMAMADPAVRSKLVAAVAEKKGGVPRGVQSFVRAIVDGDADAVWAELRKRFGVLKNPGSKVASHFADSVISSMQREDLKAMLNKALLAAEAGDSAMAVEVLESSRGLASDVVAFEAAESERRKKLLMERGNAKARGEAKQVPGSRKGPQQEEGRPEQK